MDQKRLRLILLGLIGVASLGFIALCVLGLSMISTKSQAMVSLKLQGEVLDNQLTSLAQAKKQVQQYSYIKNVAAEVIPNDKDQAQAVLEIFQIADESGIGIDSITFPASTLGLATADATTASPSALISQAKPVPGIKGLYSVQLTIVPQTGTGVPASKAITYDKMLDFLDRIEHNERTSQITQISVQLKDDTIANDPASSSIAFSLTTNIFIKP